MPRPKNLRHLAELPIVKGFRPIWLRPNLREAVKLSLEEYEVIRLIDYEGQIHEQAAVSMQVSRPTITRIYEEARRKLSTALVEGRSLLIEGGQVKFADSHYYCEDCHSKSCIEDTGDTPHCPYCGSTRIISLNDCFQRGCHKCRRCHTPRKRNKDT